MPAGKHASPGCARSVSMLYELHRNFIGALTHTDPTFQPTSIHIREPLLATPRPRAVAVCGQRGEVVERLCTTYILMTRPQAPGRPQTVLGREGARRRATDRSNY